MFKVISCYTINTPYEEVFNTILKPSLEKLNLPFKVYPTKSLGSWRLNTNLKTKIVLQALEELNTDVVFLDADAIVNEPPELFNNIPLEYDMAVHYFDAGAWYQKKIEKKHILSGTMFFRNRDICKKILKECIDRIKISNLSQQFILDRLLKENKEIKVFPLPLEYCYIASLPNGKEPHIKVEKPVITHYQASRRLRNDKSLSRC